MKKWNHPHVDYAIIPEINQFSVSNGGNMECAVGFLLFFALIVWIANKIEASQRTENQSRAYRRRYGDDGTFADAFLALDAAEHGIFTPWGEDAVRRADGAFSGYSSENEYGSEDMDWDEPRYEDESEDHWGPV